MESIGIDVIEVERFQAFKKDDPFIVASFTPLEIEYCFLHANPAPHLAGHFAAKEAGRKAYSDASFLLTTLEVRHASTGAPELWKEGVKLPILVSISHANSVAVAVVAR